MSRELKRVPLDFDWPLKKVWKGYINPHYESKCPNKFCQSGTLGAVWWLDAISRFITILAEEAQYSEEEISERRARGQRIPHPYIEEFPTRPGSYDETLLPGPEFAEFVKKLTGKDKIVSGSSAVYRALLNTAGLPEVWGECKVCQGTGVHPDVVEQYKAWEPSDPPAGEGWQLWETVSEGSPVSPVFATKELFIEYLIGNGHSLKAAQNFCDSMWCPSGVIHNGVMKTGIDSCE